jgi:hypothetical protein
MTKRKQKRNVKGGIVQRRQGRSTARKPLQSIHSHGAICFSARAAGTLWKIRTTEIPTKSKIKKGTN